MAHVGEIRSTIDLIMERTRGMSLSEEEKEDFRKEEFQKKARGLKLRLLDNPSTADEILAGLRQDSETDQRLLESLLWKELLGDLTADGPMVQRLDLLEKMPQAAGKEQILKALRDTFKASAKMRAKDRKKILARERKRLAAFGVSGSAVVPKLPADSDIDTGFATKVDEYKAQLLDNTP